MSVGGCPRGLMTENDAFQALMALRNVNEALLQGLKACLYVLENEENLSPERRKCLIASIKGLIEQGEKVFESVPAEH